MLVGTTFVMGFALLASVARLGTRASSRGIHGLLTDFVPWSAIHRASRDGERVICEYVATAPQRPSSTELRLTPELVAALQNWLGAEHPVRRAIGHQRT